MSKVETLFPDNPNELRTVEEVANALGRSKEVVLAYIQKGWLPATDDPTPGRRGRPRKLIRAGDIYRVAFQPRWEAARKTRVTSGGKKIYTTTLPEE